MNRSVITGTGSYIPEIVKTNKDFSTNQFYSAESVLLDVPATEIAKKFNHITGIEERRYVPGSMTASDIAAIAAAAAIKDSGVDAETIDQLIVAHNFGDVLDHTVQSDAVPSLASRVKHLLGIKNPACIAYDVLFGCPGWLQGLIQADAFFKGGLAKKALVIGTETLSRVIDKSDRDCMIFSDGAGACVVEYQQQLNNEKGILGCSMQSHCGEEAGFIYMGPSNLPGADAGVRYIKMKGRKVYEYAVVHVAAAMKDCLDKSGVSISQLKKVFIHQANKKMDNAIIHALYKLYDVKDISEFIMPMSIQWLGNSSVATIPTLYDRVRKNLVADHTLNEGDLILFASIGAGMNINAVCYRV